MLSIGQLSTVRLTRLSSIPIWSPYGDSFQKAAYAEFHKRGFEILGFNGDQEFNRPVELLRKQEIQWPQAQFDRDLIENRFQISSWPTEVLINENRKVISCGFTDYLSLHGKDLTATLKILLPEQ